MLILKFLRNLRRSLSARLEKIAKKTTKISLMESIKKKSVVNRHKLTLESPPLT
jgi:hypothetical protein